MLHRSSLQNSISCDILIEDLLWKSMSKDTYQSILKRLGELGQEIVKLRRETLNARKHIVEKRDTKEIANIKKAMGL